jgi:flavodoxin
MKICIIYHSETGNTRHVAQHIASAFGAQLIEVTDTVSYNRLSRFLVLCKMANREEKTAIEPASVDISGFDLVVFGSPVWAFKPTPVIHAAIDGLKGCMGKPAVAFSTHSGREGKTDEILINGLKYGEWSRLRLPISIKTIEKIRKRQKN